MESRNSDQARKNFAGNGKILLKEEAADGENFQLCVFGKRVWIPEREDVRKPAISELEG